MIFYLRPSRYKHKFEKNNSDSKVTKHDGNLSIKILRTLSNFNGSLGTLNAANSVQISVRATIFLFGVIWPIWKRVNYTRIFKNENKWLEEIQKQVGLIRGALLSSVEVATKKDTHFSWFNFLIHSLMA